MSSSVAKIARAIAGDEETKFEATSLVDRFTGVLAEVSGLTNNSKLSKAITLGSLAVSIGHTGKGIWDFYHKSKASPSFHIKISEKDAIFEIVENWLMDALPEDKQRSVYAHSKVSRRGRMGGALEELASALGHRNPLGDKDKVLIQYTFDGAIVQDVEVGGHTVSIYTETPESYGKMEAGNKNFKTLRTIVINCKSIEARDAVLGEIAKAAQGLAEGQPSIHISAKYGGFHKRSELQERTRESVILKEGQMDRILDHINTFLSNREAYEKVNLPFRTGILLYGEPGSGKSSTAAAIAHELAMDVYIISLSSMNDDDSLGECFSIIPENSVVILEDIDIAHATKDREKDDAGVTMSGLLNVLDGFQSSSGVITIMTTNRLDVLDEAIIRPGRVDLKENLDCLDDYQLHGLCEYFMGFVPEGLPSVTPEDKITSADILGVVRRHLPDFENAERDLVSFITKTLDKEPAVL